MSKTGLTKRKDAETFEMILLAKRDELLKRIEQHRMEMQSERDPDDEGATAVRNFERELAVTNWDRGMRALREVEMALRSIDAGEYGRCTGCGEQISDARLHALPWTRVCVECAGGGVRRTVIPRDHMPAQVLNSAAAAKERPAPEAD
jgi:DnaK suppressor protein